MAKTETGHGNGVNLTFALQRFY